MPKEVFIEEQPLIVDFTTVRGDDRNLSLTYTEGDGIRPIDLSKAKGEFEIKEKANSTVVLTKLTTENKLVKLGKGTIDILLADSELKQIEGNSLFYDFRILQNGKTKTLFAGKLRFWNPVVKANG